MTNQRVDAANIIQSVLFKKKSLEQVLDSDDAWVKACCYGVLRHYGELNWTLQQLLEKPLKAKDHDIYCLLLVGLYQAKAMRVAKHALVNETVDATPANKDWARGLINAVLHRAINETFDIPQSETSAVYNHPSWYIDKLKKTWPKDWQRIVKANNEEPPLVLRVNQKNILRDEYVAECKRLQVEVDCHYAAHSGVTLKDPVPVKSIPGFVDGRVSVQDGAAQLAVSCLELHEPDLRVLDACAAPGGKTCHILEAAPRMASFVALDKSQRRLEKIFENLNRLQLTADCRVADAADIDDWWDGKPYDRILLDAPCSASGVVRRHPDIKWLLQKDSFAALAEQQLKLLTNLWQVLAPGGVCCYATCSVFEDENENIIRQFVSQTDDCEVKPAPFEWGQALEYGRQILPGDHNMDGFYYCCLQKVANAS
jgi:16S rRNA (cytosine967-C5)-methyltransferase